MPIDTKKTKMVRRENKAIRKAEKRRDAKKLKDVKKLARKEERTQTDGAEVSKEAKEKESPSRISNLLSALGGEEKESKEKQSEKAPKSSFLDRNGAAFGALKDAAIVGAKTAGAGALAQIVQNGKVDEKALLKYGATAAGGKLLTSVLNSNASKLGGKGSAGYNAANTAIQSAIGQLATDGKIDAKATAAAVGSQAATNLAGKAVLEGGGSELLSGAVGDVAGSLIQSLVANGSISAEDAATAAASEALGEAAQKAVTKQLGGTAVGSAAGAGVAGAAINIGTQLIKNGKLDAKETGVAVASAVASYAAAGTVAGPIGTVIGAAVGVAVSLLATKEGRAVYKDLKKHQFNMDKDTAKQIGKTLLKPTPKNIGRTAKNIFSRPKKRWKKLKSIFGGREKSLTVTQKVQKTLVSSLRFVLGR